jgi:hypothetical protein
LKSESGRGKDPQSGAITFKFEATISERPLRHKMLTLERIEMPETTFTQDDIMTTL